MKKRNYLLEKIINIFSLERRGNVLDLGCGDGDYSMKLKGLGFNVVAADLDIKRFKNKGQIDFRVCDITQKLPFTDEFFDYILFAEVIEHLKNPYEVIKEVNRILKKTGKLILSTPNILNLKSRVRYLFEGCYEYFREPPLEQAKNPKEVIFNLHILPWKYQELEYLLSDSGFKIENIFTSVYEGIEWCFLTPLITMQLYSKQRRSFQKGGVDYTRINKIMLSPQIMFGRHLIIKAGKM